LLPAGTGSLVGAAVAEGVPSAPRPRGLAAGLNSVYAAACQCQAIALRTRHRAAGVASVVLRLAGRASRRAGSQGIAAVHCYVVAAPSGGMAASVPVGRLVPPRGDWAAIGHQHDRPGWAAPARFPEIFGRRTLPPRRARLAALGIGHERASGDTDAV